MSAQQLLSYTSAKNGIITKIVLEYTVLLCLPMNMVWVLWIFVYLNTGYMNRVARISCNIPLLYSTANDTDYFILCCVLVVLPTLASYVYVYPYAKFLEIETIRPYHKNLLTRLIDEKKNGDKWHKHIILFHKTQATQ